PVPRNERVETVLVRRFGRHQPAAIGASRRWSDIVSLRPLWEQWLNHTVDGTTSRRREIKRKTRRRPLGIHLRGRRSPARDLPRRRRWSRNGAGVQVEECQRY